MPVAHAQQPAGGHRFLGAFDLNQLTFTEIRRTLNKSRRGVAEHHATRRSHRFHPLRHPHLFANGGVTKSTRTDLTGDHLA